MNKVLCDCRCGAKASIAVDTAAQLYYVHCSKCFMRTAPVKDKLLAIVCWNSCMRRDSK